MAHTKAGGAAKRTVNVAGKRLGVKVPGGAYAKAGNIIVRQRGTRYYPGKGADIGRDHTIFAVTDGYVYFRNMTGHKRAKKYIDILPEDPEVVVEAKTVVSPTKEKKAESKSTPAKKATSATKKTATKAKSTKAKSA